MEIWMLYSLLAGVFLGTSNFLSKIIANNKTNKNKIMLYAMVPYIILPIFYFMIQGLSILLSGFLIFLVAIRIIISTEKNLLSIEALKYIEASVYFPLHKIIQITGSFIVGMVIFGEYLDTIEIGALFLGGLVILLLNSKGNRAIQVNYKKGVLFLLAVNFLILFSSSINKYIASIGFDFVVYLFLSGIFGSTYLLFMKGNLYVPSSPDENKAEIKIGLLKGTLKFFGFIFFLMALSEGSFVLVQLMHISTIIIPIILSIIFFGEKLNIQKIGALLLFGGVIYLISL